MNDQSWPITRAREPIFRSLLDADDDVITRDRATPEDAFAGFLSLTTDRAGDLQTALADRGVRVDSRGRHLRFGPAPYLSDPQLEAAMATLGELIEP